MIIVRRCPKKVYIFNILAYYIFVPPISDVSPPKIPPSHRHMSPSAVPPTKFLDQPVK